MTDIVSKRKLLKIKTGAVGRLFKETTLYRVEAEKLEEKKTKLLAAGADPQEWDFKNTSKMKDESDKMVGDTTRRLKTAVEEFEVLIANLSSEMSQDEELLKAEQLLQKIKGTRSDNEGENTINSSNSGPSRAA